MKASKERKMDRKMKHKALSVKKTEESRQRRLNNKAKRAEILNINPNLKITIVDGITYTDDGINGRVAVEVIDGKIRSKELRKQVSINDNELEVIEVVEDDAAIGKAIDVQIEKERLGVFSKLVDKFRKK
jgi:hypothetical protein|tara:strand:- start:24 stop:413 length:390 start_codon:yes stop_codon:yes gene_type:complete